MKPSHVLLNVRSTSNFNVQDTINNKTYHYQIFMDNFDISVKRNPLRIQISFDLSSDHYFHSFIVILNCLSKCQK